MQIRQKASAMTDKKPVIFKQTLPSRFISFSKIQKIIISIRKQSSQ